MNAKEAANSMTLPEYRQWWYGQLGEKPPELGEELTVGQARDERIIREGYNQRRNGASNPTQGDTGMSESNGMNENEGLC